MAYSRINVTNVIAPRTLRTFWDNHPHAEVPLKAWLRDIQKSRYESFADLRERYPNADLAKAKDGSTVVVFNVGGNKYRLVVYISYKSQRVYIRQIFTHEEYDFWNRQGRPT
ncbi:MAG: type II toxin-antitoxin system HigB family toxin [Trueperaceae bacterium]|nr:type II toxin-antitoxin system HigB family toxin [Trueperaceae bacterium]